MDIPIQLQRLDAILNPKLLGLELPYCLENFYGHYSNVIGKLSNDVDELFFDNGRFKDPEINEITKKANEYFEYLKNYLNKNKSVKYLILKVFFNDLISSDSIDWLMNEEDFCGNELSDKECLFYSITNLLRNLYKIEFLFLNGYTPNDINYVYLTLAEQKKEKIYLYFNAMKYIENKFSKILSLSNEDFQKFATGLCNFYVRVLLNIQNYLKNDKNIDSGEIINYINLLYDYLNELYGNHLENNEVSEFFEIIDKFLNNRIKINEVHKKLEHLEKIGMADVYVELGNLINTKDNLYEKFIKKDIKFVKETPRLNPYFIFDKEPYILELKDIIKEYRFNIFGKKNYKVNISVKFYDNHPKELFIVIQDDNRVETHNIKITNPSSLFSNISDILMKLCEKNFEKIVVLSKDYEILDNEMFSTISGVYLPNTLVKKWQETMGKVINLFTSIFLKNNRPVIYKNLKELRKEFEKRFNKEILPNDLSVLFEFIMHDDMDEFLETSPEKKILESFLRSLETYYKNELLMKIDTNIEDAIDIKKYVRNNISRLFAHLANDLKSVITQFTYFYYLILLMVFEKINTIINKTIDEDESNRKFLSNLSKRIESIKSDDEQQTKLLKKCMYERLEEYKLLMVYNKGLKTNIVNDLKASKNSDLIYLDTDHLISLLGLYNGELLSFNEYFTKDIIVNKFNNFLKLCKNPDKILNNLRIIDYILKKDVGLDISSPFYDLISFVYKVVKFYE